MAEQLRLDAASVEQADWLVRASRTSFNESIEQGSVMYEVAYAERVYAEPEPASSLLRAFAFENEIALDDVAADVDAFSALSQVALRRDGFLPCLRLSRSIAVPFLPVPAQESGFDSGYQFLEFLSSRAEMMPVGVASESFFKGLQSYLAFRIGGTRWSRQSAHPAAKETLSLGSGPPGNGQASGSGGNFQKWSVRCVGAGHSIYSVGTHAARYPANYLGAPTTPVDIYLPMGTHFLGADAGPGGRIVWDDKAMVSVPSLNPHFQTKAF